jgi:hypothetical protein
MDNKANRGAATTERYSPQVVLHLSTIRLVEKDQTH